MNHIVCVWSCPESPESEQSGTGRHPQVIMFVDVFSGLSPQGTNIPSGYD